jgi:hypothetical protein
MKIHTFNDWKNKCYSCNNISTNYFINIVLMPGQIVTATTKIFLNPKDAIVSGTCENCFSKLKYKNDFTEHSKSYLENLIALQ